ncbi:MAG: DUF2169 domain-containing protein [Deltaproteobacteria bacterium]|nr:DUF2169 domain-containing protein [Deltaproteobacteria bacterium]MBW2532525.1 DUF2169 domain-containing protein [Deltaproteobacteria bacterium]
MKTIKPLRLGILHKTFEHEGVCRLVVSLFVYVPLRQERVLLSEVSMWKAVGEELREGEPLDECMPKSRAEVLVTGYGYPLGGRPRPACSVRVKIGQIDKSVYVVGDRFWKGGVATDPIAFEKMSLSWQNAFGGPDVEQNPVGKGAAPITTDDGIELHPLPNLENPKRLIGSPSDQPDPVGLGAMDLIWPQRFHKAGTYDNEWLEERFPGYAADIDWTFFNTAPDDQQQDRFFRGDEPFRLEYMHPKDSVIEGRLPNVATRCFINRRAEGPPKLEEVKTKIDTVRFLPHLDRAIVVFRGTIEVAEDDAADVLQLMAGVEERGLAKPLDHYERVFAERMDKEKAALAAIRDNDLVPEDWLPPDDGGTAEISEYEEITRSDDLLAQNMRRSAEAQLDKLREDLEAAGIPPEEQDLPELAPVEKPPTMDQLGQYVDEQLAAAEQQRVEAEQQTAEMERQARELCAAHGVDWDEMVEKARQEAAGPPSFTADGELERLRERAQLLRNVGTPDEGIEAQLDDPALRDKLVVAEQQLRAAYRQFCHHLPAAARLGGDQSAAVRKAALEAVDQGQELAERDFTGVDLSGADLRQAKLRRAWLEAANLADTDLRGVDLSGAVLTRADLSGADLTGADLSSANLGEANLTATKLGGGAKLHGTVLAKALLADTDLSGADLTGADLLETRFDRTKLDGVNLRQAILLSVDLSGVSAVGADLSSSTFFDSTFDEADFSEATFQSTNLVGVRGRRAKFRKAKLGNARLVQDAVFDEADFFGADLSGANLRGTSLVGADLRQAKLDGSDLSECKLSRAKLSLATAVESMFVRTDLTGARLDNVNLMNGILQKAIIKGTDFRNANLFRADCAKVDGDEATNFDGANMDFIRFVRGGKPARKE